MVYLPYQVSAAVVAPRPTAVLVATTTWTAFPGLWPRLLDEVYAGVRWDGAGESPEHRHGRNVMFYRDAAPQVRVEVGVELDQPAEVDSGLIRSVLPGGTVATTVHRGGYDGLPAAHQAVKAWCQAHGHRLDGARWEVYGHWYADPALVETEVSYLIDSLESNAPLSNATSTSGYDDGLDDPRA